MKRLAVGLRPYSRAERRALARDSARAPFPKCAVALQRLEATCQLLESQLKAARVLRDAGASGAGGGGVS